MAQTLCTDNPLLFSAPLHIVLVRAQLVAWYIFSRRIARNVRYGTGPRQHLDLYWPPGASRKVASAESTKMPVVIYITGMHFMTR